MAFQVGELYWKITGENKNINAKLKETEKQVGGLQKSFGSVATFLKGAFVAAAVAGITKVTKALITAASNAEETENKFNVTFSTIIERADAAAESLSEGFGLSSQKAQQLLADTGDLLSGFGFTQDAALDLSTQVNELAVDLASFTNYAGGAEGASAALTKGLLGEREAMKSLGIAIMETDIKQLAEDRGIVGELDRQTKAMLTLELALQQSKNAIGDFERSSDSYANVSRTAESATQDLAAAIGQSLLPAATNIKRVYAEIARNMADVIEQANELKVARDAEAEGNASLEQQLAILIARRERYTAATRAQREALDAEITNLQRRIAARTAYVQAVEAENAAAEAAAQAEMERLEALNSERERTNNIADEYALKLTELTETDRERIEREREAALVAAAGWTNATNAVNAYYDALLDGLEESSSERKYDLKEQYAEEEELNRAKAEARKANLEAQKEADAEAAAARSAQISAGLALYSQYASSIAGIFSSLIASLTAGDEELTEEKKKNLRILFGLQKAANIAQIGIDTATAVMRGFAELGPIAGAIAQAVTIGIGAAQIGIVASTQPSFAVGAWELPSDMTAQVHKGEMIIPATFADSIRQVVSGGTTNNSTVNNNGVSTANITVMVGPERILGPIQVALDNRNLTVKESTVIYGR